MISFSILSLAISSLARNKMRSLLTTLGVVIGVAAVVVMQAMGEGATAYVGNTISGLGTNMLVVIPAVREGRFGGMTQGVPQFKNRDVLAIREGAPALALLTGVAAGPTLQVIAGEKNRTTSVSGVDPEFFLIRDWGATEGRLFDADDDRRGAQVCVVGSTVASELFPRGGAVGSEVRLRNTTCRIVGVLESKGSAGFGQDQDDAMFLPRTTYSRRVIGEDTVAVMLASAKSEERIDEARDQIMTVLRRQRRVLEGEQENFMLQDPRELQSALQSVTGTLTLVLAGIAAISLIVGGIGIMNIMLVSVTERTREIGVRLAIGARAKDILRQFLVESVILSGAGGLIGLAIGLGGSAAITAALDLPLVVTPLAPTLAIGVSLLIGVVFGVFPARKASRLNPIAALRWE